MLTNSRHYHGINISTGSLRRLTVCWHSCDAIWGHAKKIYQSKCLFYHGQMKFGVLLISMKPRPLDRSANLRISLLISQPKHMLCVLKEPSQWDGSFEHPKHMIKLMGKKKITILHSKSFRIWTYETLIIRIKFTRWRWFRERLQGLPRTGTEISAVFLPCWTIFSGSHWKLGEARSN